MEAFHIDLRQESILDQSSGSTGSSGQILIAVKSILPPPTEGSEVTECHGAVWLFNGTLRGFSVSLKDNEWSHVEDQTSSH